MMTVNDNKLPKLPFSSSSNIHKLKTVFQTRTCQVLSFMLHAKSRKTRCLMLFVSASSTARKQIPVKKKNFPQNLLYIPKAKITQNFLSASIKTDGYAKTPLILCSEIYFT
jgi:hypothetical protein